MIIRSKLICSRESAAVTDGQLTNIGVFQLKGLRRILGAQATVEHRRCTNEYLLEEANRKVYQDAGKRIKAYSELHSTYKNELFIDLIVRDDPCTLR